MVTVEELKPSNRDPNRWLAVLDSGQILRVGRNEIADFALYAGRELTEQEYRNLSASLRQTGLRSRALEALLRRPMSRRELTRKLESWEASEEEAEAVCDRLEELGYLNDTEYARRLAENVQARGYGVMKIRDEFYRRGVPRDLWDDVLEELEDPGEILDGILQSKLGGRNPDRKERSKVMQMLSRRGFLWEDIRDAMDRFSEGLEEEFED